MARGFPLQLVLDLAVRHAEEKSREAKRAHGEWLRARGRRAQILALRDERITELASQLRPGLPAEQLRARVRLLQMQEAELVNTTQNVETTYQAWQAKLALWLQLQDRVKALKVLEQRHLDARVVQARRVEQRQHDELAQVTRFWRRDSRDVM